MIDEQLIEILACPEDKSRVNLADQSLIEKINQAISSGSMSNRGGAPVSEPIEGGLLRADGKWLYPIREDIPIMLVEEALPVSEAAQAG